MFYRYDSSSETLPTTGETLTELVETAPEGDFTVYTGGGEDQRIVATRRDGRVWMEETASCSRCGEELWGEAAVQMQRLDGELVCNECGEGDYPAVREELAGSLYDSLHAWITAVTDEVDLPATAKVLLEERLRRGLGGDAELDDLFCRVFGFSTNDVGR